MNAWRRVVATLLVAAVVAAACVLLGLWQWHRYEWRSAAVEVVQANYHATPEPLEDVLPGGGPVPDALVWQPVTVSGRYLGDATVLLRNRPVDGKRGFHVLGALLVTGGPLDGRVVVVDRGWLDGGADAATLPAVPAEPRGEVALVGRLRAAEAPTDDTAPPGQVRSIAPTQVQRASPEPWPGPGLDGYLQAVTEDGAAPAGLGPLEQPSTDLGSHLSYAFQWWVFGAGALVGAVILLRRDDPAPGPRAPGPSSASRRRAGRAEQEEDALLDAQEQAARAAAARLHPTTSAPGPTATGG